MRVLHKVHGRTPTHWDISTIAQFNVNFPEKRIQDLSNDRLISLGLGWESTLCSICIDIVEVIAISVIHRRKTGKYADCGISRDCDDFLASKVYDEEEMKWA